MDSFGLQMVAVLNPPDAISWDRKLALLLEIQPGKDHRSNREGR
jgi:hypothetical protein